MKFQIEIKCDNAAFSDGDCEREVIRILKEDVIERLSNGDANAEVKHTLFDINGNSVGTARFVGS